MPRHTRSASASLPALNNAAAWWIESPLPMTAHDRLDGHWAYCKLWVAAEHSCTLPQDRHCVALTSPKNLRRCRGADGTFERAVPAMVRWTHELLNCGYHLSSPSARDEWRW